MAMIVRLLNNRRNPCRGRCRGLLDHLKLRPCNFIQTQTLSSTRSLPFSPPTPSTEIPAFEPTSQHHRDLFSTGVVRSLRDYMLELSRRHNGMHSIKSIRGYSSKSSHAEDMASIILLIPSYKTTSF